MQLFDLVAISKNGTLSDKIYEIKLGEFNIEHLKYVKAKVEQYVLSYSNYFNRRCNAEIAYISKDENKLREISDYFKENITLFYTDMYQIDLKGYYYNDL